MDAIQVRLPFRRPPGTDDAYRFLVALRVDDQNHPPHDWADRDETVFFARVGIVEDLEVVIPSCEEDACLLERNAMLLAVVTVLGVIPDDPRQFILGQ